ncbi:G-protein coupled receptor 4-like [Cottoperca gobio]|uniref:G-protein coupled receptor 4-like n=1 Tax=Cottoperca gobio TaxID=56716 RepID=A0A6J2R778_COTGO|nr:G-protein coupled receptor 4-like [Cottoperca gobio]
MAVNIPGVIAMSFFYLLVLGTGIWASFKSKREQKKSSASGIEMALLGNRSINVVVGIFTMTDKIETFWNISDDYDWTPFSSYEYSGQTGFISYVVTCIIICIGLPLTLTAIFAVYFLVQKDHVAPIFVMNLLISDVIQLCCMIVLVVPPKHGKTYHTIFIIYYSGLVASVCFMVSIGLERYLVIAHPLWYRFRRSIKISVVVCVVIWVLPAVYLLRSLFWYITYVQETISAVFFLLPLPLLIFFLSGTLRALSASISVPADDKRRIVGMLVLVLLIYTLLFLPYIIWLLSDGIKCDITFIHLSSLLLRLSPLADLALYVLMRKGTIDKLLASVCCCRMDSNDSSSSAV